MQGNKVTLRIPFTGTHPGNFWGLEPTGKKINVTETLILRVEGGKIAEKWKDCDECGMRIQWGFGETKLNGSRSQALHEILRSGGGRGEITVFVEFQ